MSRDLPSDATMNRVARQLGAPSAERFLEVAPFPTRCAFRLACELSEALELADALLSGANMNRKVVERKVRTALNKGTGR